MNGNITYVQKSVSMELNKDMISIAGKYAGYEKLDDGFSVLFEEALPASGFKASGLDDLNSFYGRNTTADSREKGKNGYRVDFRVVTDDIIRVTVNGLQAGKRNLFIKYNDSPPAFEFIELDDVLVLKTSRIIISFNKLKACYTVCDRSGRILFEEINDEKSIYSGYYSPPLSKVHADGSTYMCQSFKRSGGEDFYGFGEQFLDFNKRGLVTEIWNVDPANTMSFKSYKNIPFFISTNGYGFLLNSPRKSFFDMGSKTAMAYNVKVQGEELDYFLIFGEDMKNVLSKYYMLTGKPAMTPRWSFGLWMSTHTVYKSDMALMDIAQEIRKRELPVDVLHIDPPWMDLNCLVCHLEWGENFKNREQMVKVLKERGFKLSLWIAPYVPLDCTMYEEGLEGGYFVKDREGNLIVNKGQMNFWSPDFVYIDFTNREAENWFKKKIKRILNEGGDIIKVDLGELGPEEALYHNGMDGAEGHNFYTLEYQRIVYEATREVKQDEAMIWCRSGFIGSHMYPVHWAGDVACNFDNMEGQLRAILGAGMSGFIFFSHDIGGFSGIPTPELYVRWFQFGMFTSHARAHGGTRHEPWFYGERVMEICKKYAELRYSLLPHLYSSAAECCIKGEPMVKALVLEYADDPNTRNIDSEYLFCNDFLVAPMFIAEGSRKIYFPEGRWIDYWNGDCYEGSRWVDYACSLERLPLFVRAGSIILKTKSGQYINEKKSWENLILEIYPELSGEKKVYFDKNDYGVVRYRMENEIVVITAENIDAKIEVNIIDRSGRSSDAFLIETK